MPRRPTVGARRPVQARPSESPGPAGQPSDVGAVGGAVAAVDPPPGRRAGGALALAYHRRQPRPGSGRDGGRGMVEHAPRAGGRSPSCPAPRCRRRSRSRPPSARRIPSVPIVWGGYFPTLYPDAAINAPYVDYVVRGQGEETLLDLLTHLADAGSRPARDSARNPSAIRGVAGLTWKDDGRSVHNPERPPILRPDALPLLPYDRVADVGAYLRPSFMGARTAVHQAALGCRYQCEFCGVVSMWNGKTLLERARPPAPCRSEPLRDRWGADAYPVLRPQLLRPRGTQRPHPRRPRQAGTALVVLCARRHAGAASRTPPGRRSARAGCAWPTSAPRRPATRLLARMRKGSKVEHTFEVARALPRIRRDPGVLVRAGRPGGSRRRSREDPRASCGSVKDDQPAVRDHPLLLQPDAATRHGGPRAAPLAAPRLPVLHSYGPSGPALPTTPEEWTEPQWMD